MNIEIAAARTRPLLMTDTDGRPITAAIARAFLELAKEVQ